jgi:peroxiredoxin Q/BCP
MLKVGERAPEFSLTADDGTRVSLKEHRGRKVVLYFYPRDNTPGCTREACDFRDRHHAIQATGAVVLGVSTDSVASHAGFRQKHALPFTLLSDAGGKVARAYGAWKRRPGRASPGTERTTFIIDGRGVITHIFPKVKVDGHADEVLAALTGSGTRPRRIPRSGPGARG